jgi:hypothetical protein
MADIIDIEILEDGSLRISTDAISAGNHRQADDLLKALSQLMGGKTTIKQKSGHRHTHTHSHNHTTHKH